MNLLFLGRDACKTAPGDDSSGILINHRVLIDTGYFLIDRLRTAGIEPCEIETVFFTHMHHDHYMGLPQLIFSYLSEGKPLALLHLYGPAGELQRIVELSMDFLQAGPNKPFYKTCGFPTLHPICAGDRFQTADMDILTCASYHAVEGLCYKIKDQSDGKIVSITGDTFYHKTISNALAGCDALVHETACGATGLDYTAPPEYLHSNIDIAVRTARETGAKRLFVIHFPAIKQKEVLSRAEYLNFPNVIYPKLLQSYEI